MNQPIKVTWEVFSDASRRFCLPICSPRKCTPQDCPIWKQLSTQSGNSSTTEEVHAPKTSPDEFRK